MTKLYEMNRHWVGVTALALTVVGIGIIGNMTFQHPTQVFSRISTEQSEATNPNFISEHFISQLKRVPQNLFGSAQHNAQTTQDQISGGTESEAAKNWTDEEWRLASGAVTAYRKGGRQALNSAASADIVWRPPEEIASKRANAPR